MRLFLALAMSILDWATCAGAIAGAPVGASLSIDVRPGSWGNAQPRDIEAVLHSVADVLRPHFPQHRGGRVQVAFSEKGPRVLPRQPGDDTFLVLLNVQDRRWDQFAYQFAHELCHIFSNYDERPLDPASREHQWFEETLCEAVSIVTLDRLTSRWNDSPPRAGWTAYAPAFREYAGRLLAASHRETKAGETVTGLYLQHAAVLERNPYLREKNELLATPIAKLLQGMPGALEAIGYLNLETRPNETFAAYLADWYACCPEPHREFVSRLMSLFGVT